MGRFDEAFNVFDENEHGAGHGAHSMEEVLTRITEMMEDGRAKPPDALEGLLNLMRPGSTENSHDIRHQLMVALYALERRDIAEHVGAAWLTQFPWGIGFHLGFDAEYNPDDMGEDGRRAFVRALCAILQAGNLKATLTPEGTIHIAGEDGESQDMSIDEIVADFRKELEDLPTEPEPETDLIDDSEIAEWLKRWMS